MRDAGQQTDKIIVADDRIATAMEGSVNQAKVAFEAANKQARVSQRAWVAVHIGLFRAKDDKGNSQPAFIIGEPLDVRVVVKNTGRTPAVNVRTMMIKKPLRKITGFFAKPDFNYEGIRWGNVGNINPDGDVFSDFVTPFTKDDFDLISTDKVRVFVYGRIEYDDVFGTHHWKNFCGQLLGGGAFAVCPYNNEMDNN